MSARFITIDRDTPLLMPPDMHDWLPDNHLVHFVVDAVSLMDLSMARVNRRGTGAMQYPPSMMLALLTYSYATGVFSSRQIERSTHDSVAVRFLCAGTHPDHDTICAFRRNNIALVESVFRQLLELAKASKLLRVGNISVAIDGTKVLASASKHSAVSYEHAGRTIDALESEVAQLLRKAEDADSTPLQDGLTIPGEIERRQERIAKLQRAKAEIEARAFARHAANQEDAAQKPAGCESQRDDDTPPDAGVGGSGPAPRPKDQVNFTDPHSRIMKTGDGFQQAYNAQAGVDVRSRLIVGARVSNAPNDKRELLPDVAEICRHVKVHNVLIDSGFVSEKAISSVECGASGNGIGGRVLAAFGRERHGRSVEQLEKRAAPPRPPADAPFMDHVRHRTRTACGRRLYKLRQQTVEPVFGIIKAAIGFRRFSLRGLQKVRSEWNLICTAYNIRRLHTLGMPALMH